MDNIAYIALSRQMTLQKQMDVISNNLANMDTAGFKVEQMMLATQPGAPAKDDQVKGPAQFSIASGLARDFSEGELTQTGRATRRGDRRQRLLHGLHAPGPALHQRRPLRDRRHGTTGHLGRRAGARRSGGEITLDPTKGRPIISADGVVSQRTKQGPTVTRVGKIGVVSFDTLSALQKDGNNLYSNTSNAQPTAAPDVRLRQGMLESSNVKPIVEITHLIQISAPTNRSPR